MAKTADFRFCPTTGQWLNVHFICNYMSIYLQCLENEVEIEQLAYLFDDIHLYIAYLEGKRVKYFIRDVPR